MLLLASSQYSINYSRLTTPNIIFPMKTKKLSEIINSVFSESKPVTTIGSLIDELEHHGMAIVLILFSIPSALPVPAAGYSTLLSVPLLAIGISFIVGRDSVWLPEKAKKKEFNPKAFSKIKSLMHKIATNIEKFSKPRLLAITRSRASKIFLGILICCLGAFMAVPIPGTNTLPAGGIFLIGFGLLEDDGLFVGAGVLYSLAALALAAFIVYYVTIYGMEGAEMAKDFIKLQLSLLN